MSAWLTARDEHALREILIPEERLLSVHLSGDGSVSALIGTAVRDAAFPEGCLLALVRRGDETIVPRGSTVLASEDRLTVIGTPEAIRSFRGQFLVD